MLSGERPFFTLNISAAEYWYKFELWIIDFTHAIFT